MRSATAIVTLIAAAVALSAGGCGGSDGPTKSEYIDKADAICRDAQQRAAPLIGQITAAVTASPTRAGLRRALAPVTALQAVGTDYRRRLDGLEQPSGDERAIDAFLTPTGQLIGILGDARPVFERGTVVAALGLLQRVQSLDAQATAAAGDYGFEVCGSVLSTPAAAS